MNKQERREASQIRQRNCQRKPENETYSDEIHNEGTETKDIITAGEDRLRFGVNRDRGGVRTKRLKGLISS